MDTVFDINSIMQNLPHRFPFLLVDRVIEFVKNERIVALKNVTINEPFFQGHFPDTPIMPGVLIVEAMGQAGGVLVTQSHPPENQGKLILFMGFDKVRFRKPVVPGDQLILELEMLKLRSKVVKMAGVAKVDEKIVAEAQLMAAYGD
ncbi:(3R)-hydroxymyristol acyl carrier protein dehydratase [Desulfosarcina cetonica]|uniref:3-hydroxyacyl-ACP dehydratase FabZ n=1 Tax=Desulfosarcina cetonica TaxID=90730 RepID=UPI0006D0DA1A|nr:3-hydroxyacyl-ACP dehydratase FabZ [Desulfosarcina cetonica]VTR64065.1 (3R)-hydroxymyristol acyl carrier protein dehydratase [Desulfosarcina cetonica]